MFWQRPSFKIILIQEIPNMTAALDRITASVDAAVTEMANAGNEMSQIAAALRTITSTGDASDDSVALNALADRLDAAAGNLKSAETAAGDVLTPPAGEDTQAAS